MEDAFPLGDFEPGSGEPTYRFGIPFWNFAGQVPPSPWYLDAHGRDYDEAPPRWHEFVQKYAPTGRVESSAVPELRSTLEDARERHSFIERDVHRELRSLPFLFAHIYARLWKANEPGDGQWSKQSRGARECFSVWYFVSKGAGVKDASRQLRLLFLEYLYGYQKPTSTADKQYVRGQSGIVISTLKRVKPFLAEAAQIDRVRYCCECLLLAYHSQIDLSDYADRERILREPSRRLSWLAEQFRFDASTPRGQRAFKDGRSWHERWVWYVDQWEGVGLPLQDIDPKDEEDLKDKLNKWRTRQRG
ncbi:MAG: hypothetical protein AAGF99_00970 [Bacteroidota bacterium]